MPQGQTGAEIARLCHRIRFLTHPCMTCTNSTETKSWRPLHGQINSHAAPQVQARMSCLQSSQGARIQVCFAEILSSFRMRFVEGVNFPDLGDGLQAV